MKQIYPDYYDRFRCIAGACPDSCCHSWEVEVDPDSAARFRALPGQLGQILREKLYEEEGITYLANQGGRCPMWRDDGLCRIQAELGHGGLCQVCQQFPRICQDYGDFVEWGLEMSCPEAARIILTAEQWHLREETRPGGDGPEYDMELMAILRETRPQALALLADGDVPVPQRLARLLLFGHQVQSWIDLGEPEPFDPAQAGVLTARCAGKGRLEPLAECYRELELLTSRWAAALGQLRRSPAWSEELCRLAQYQIYRYYHQAVADWDLAARIKFIVAGCILLAHLPAGEERISLISLYAKEIENDGENVNTLLDGAFSRPGLTDENLFGLLS